MVRDLKESARRQEIHLLHLEAVRLEKLIDAARARAANLYQMSDAQYELTAPKVEKPPSALMIPDALFEQAVEDYAAIYKQQRGGRTIFVTSSGRKMFHERLRYVLERLLGKIVVKPPEEREAILGTRTPLLQPQLQPLARETKFDTRPAGDRWTHGRR